MAKKKLKRNPYLTMVAVSIESRDRLKKIIGSDGGYKTATMTYHFSRALERYADELEKGMKNGI